MRKFSSYGPVDTDLHYYVPREALIEQAYSQLVGSSTNPNKGGHYITVWAPRQRGKSWVMVQTLQRLRKDSRFDTVMLNLEDLKLQSNVDKIVQTIAYEIIRELGLEEVRISQPRGTSKGGFSGGVLNMLSYLPFRVRPQLSSFFADASVDQFHRLFEKDILKKPLILILDEFDALSEEAISALAGVFRKIYLTRQYQTDKTSAEKKYLLHGVALIGVRSVLATLAWRRIENKRGSPFNIQRSLHIPNLTKPEVEEMLRWYERESGQEVEKAVIERIYYETQGQPGFVSWLGELLTETYNEHNSTITSHDFEIAYSAAVDALPNANIQNLISKASQAPYQQLVLEMFQTKDKIPFRYNDSDTNFLYMNGVVDQEVVKRSKEIHRYLKFPCPFVQKRLFNYFSSTLFRYVGDLHGPFEDLPEFPTGNGQTCPDVGRISLIIRYAGEKYGLEVKSYANETAYKKGIIIMPFRVHKPPIMARNWNLMKSRLSSLSKRLMTRIGKSMRC